MKREQIIAKIKETAKSIYGDNIDVHTSRDLYPKCYVVSLNEKGFVERQLTPAYRPSELLSYVQGFVRGVVSQ